VSGSKLPRAVASGVLEIDGRKIPCAVLSNKMRVWTELPMADMLDGMPDVLVDSIRVPFIASDGAEIVGYSAQSLVHLASAHVEGYLGAPERCTEAQRDRAGRCQDFLSAMTAIGLRALKREADPQGTAADASN
jgi:hypothetical protein